MDYVFAIKGEAQTKVVVRGLEMVRLEVTPFVGVRCNGSIEVGLGILDQQGRVLDFYAPDFFKNILQSWRAMQILGHLTHIRKTALQDCYNAAAKDPSYMESRSFNHLRDDVAHIGWQHFDGFLARMRVIQPNSEDLDQMLRVFQEAGVNFDVFEFQCELRDGRFRATPYLKQLIAKEVEAYKRQNAEERARYEEQLRQIREESPRFKLRRLLHATFG